MDAPAHRELPAPPPSLAVKLALALRQALLRLADAVVPGEAAVFERIAGIAFTQSLAVMARHRVADLLAHGPRSAEELAEQTGLNPELLERTLRALCTINVFAREPDGRFRNNRVSSGLRRDRVASMGPFAEYFGTASNLRAWADFEETVRTGKNGFERQHGMSVWAWFDQHPDERALFAQVMTSLTELMAPSIARAYPWREVQTVCDVGGGRGQLLAEILRQQPHLRGMLFDGAGVIELARTYLASMELAERVQLESGSFFERVPRGADAYLLKDILHDWDDARALTILRHCREALGPSGRVLIAELLVEPDTTSGPGPFTDLHMAVACSDGRQRSTAQFARLFEQSGLRLARVVPTPMGFSIVEAVPR